MRSLRLSIAGLMGVVLVSAICLAALISGSVFWAGAMFVTVAGILTLAVIGAVCRRGPERAWWLGFALFGWGYLLLNVLTKYWYANIWFHSLAALPTFISRVEGFLSSVVQHQYEAISLRQAMVPGPLDRDCFRDICHDHFSLFAAIIGGVLAWSLFGGKDSVVSGPAPGVPADEPIPTSPRRRTILIISAGVACLLGLALFGLRQRLWLASGLVLTATWGVLGLAILGAACGRGKRRVAMIGTALFGIGYMTLIFRTDTKIPNPAYVTGSYLLNLVRSRLPEYLREIPPDSPAIAVANFRIREVLDRPTPTDFGFEGISLKRIVGTIEAAARDTQGRGFPIHFDPGVQRYEFLAEETPIPESLMPYVEEAPLGTSLAIAMKQLGLSFRVQGGALVIMKQDADYAQDLYEDPFLTIGHCFLALLAAIVGSVLAPLVAGKSVS